MCARRRANVKCLDLTPSTPTLPDAILNQCQWIVGEFHDHTGFEVLARLAPHFHLDLKKKIFRSRFRFHACNLSKMQQLSRSDLDALQR